MNKLLSSLYYNVGSPAGFGGTQSLLREAKKRNPKVTIDDVQKFLNKSYTYTIHKSVKTNFPRRKTTAFCMDSHWQADLCDLQKLAEFNSDKKYILTVICVFSKMAWAEPLADKKPTSVRDAFANILEKSGRKPWYLYTDSGGEFLGRSFQDFLVQNYIIHYVSQSSEVKCAVVERLNRTLKTRMWKYFTQNRTRKWINILQKLMKAINHSYHSTIKLRPIDVTRANERAVAAEIYQHKGSRTHPRFSIGDPVRISREKGVFKKGYHQSFTDEIFKVKERFEKAPTIYILEDEKNEQIIGAFYEGELIPAIVRK